NGALSSRKQFRPAFVAALLLIVVGIGAGVIYLNSLRQADVASKPTIPNPTLPLGGTTVALQPDEGHKNKETRAEDSSPKEKIINRPTPLVAKRTPASAAQKKIIGVAALKRSEKPVVKEQTNDDGAQLAADVAARDQLITNTRTRTPEAVGDFDFEVARHAERAELLLRSFRNVRLPASTRSLDVSYERANARKLLYQNIALRRDAAERRDQPTTEILNQLEPILLDIANLPERARARDVRSIERRMQKKEIVATLQVRTLVASN
ncbi:MAG TPA: hypothetical protein VF766_03260, partial [Pyrinomonadaceae bacterium]